MPRSVRLPGLAARFIPAILSVGAVLAAWESYVRIAGLSPATLPAPSRVIAQAFAERAALLANSWPTLQADRKSVV